MMAMSQMEMVFYTSTTTPLFSLAWSPSSTGSYAGTCIFLIVLAVVFRFLLAGKSILERRWRDQNSQRQYVRVRGKPSESERIDANTESKEGLLVTANGTEQDVRIVSSRTRPVAPFRLSVDLPRAAYVTVLAGVGYLLYVEETVALIWKTYAIRVMLIVDIACWL